MSRLFDDASSEGLTYGAAVLSVEPISMACWFNVDDLTIGHRLMDVTEAASTDNFFALHLAGATAGDPVRAWQRTSGASEQANTSVGFSANVWQHACAVFASAASRSIYLNGGNKVTNTNLLVSPSGIDRTDIGSFRGASGFTSGRVAEAGIWNVELTDADVASLATGIDPLTVRPEGLVALWRLIRDDTDIIGGKTLLLVNTPTFADHAPIIRSRPRVAFVPPAAARNPWNYWAQSA